MRVIVVVPCLTLSVAATWPLAVGAQSAGESEINATSTTVIVTARKREERLIDVPVAVSSLSARNLDEYDVHRFADYAGKVPSVSWAYGNGTTGGGETGTGFANARTIAIRGIAGARTTGYYLDDTPLPGAVDMRVVDLDSIEVLRGPQGTLFGESSLGGNVRLLSKAPSLTRNDFRYRLGVGKTQDAEGYNSEAEAVGNVVLSEGKAALRAAVVTERSGGFLTRSYLSDIADPTSQRREADDQAASHSFGGSLTGLLRITPDFDISLRLVHQDQRHHGAPTPYAPLPDFDPVAVLERTADIQPKASDRWTLPIVALSYRGEGWTLSSSTSQFRREARDLEDSTEGTTQFLDSYGLGATPAQGFAWRAVRTSRQLAHETRIAFEPVGRFSGIVGVHYSDFRSHRHTPAVYGTDVFSTPGQTLLWQYDDRYSQEDRSMFGELYIDFAERYTLTLGNRRYWLRQSDRAGFDGALYGLAFRSRTSNDAHGDNPKLALSYKANARSLLYASASKGFRAGGADVDWSPFGCVTAAQAAALSRIKPDSVWSYELGGKLELADPALLLSGAVYRIDWQDIQQPALIPTCGFYWLSNAGAARIDGAELEISGRLGAATRVRAMLSYNDARITEQGTSALPDGARVRQIPNWTANFGVVHSWPLAHGRSGFAVVDYSYTGDSVSGNSVGTDVLRDSYSILNLRLGLRWEKSELALGLSNATNARPNLGDIGYLGYIRNDAAGSPIPQVVTLPPRTLSLSYRQAF